MANPSNYRLVSRQHLCAARHWSRVLNSGVSKDSVPSSEGQVLGLPTSHMKSSFRQNLKQHAISSSVNVVVPLYAYPPPKPLAVGSVSVRSVGPVGLSSTRASPVRPATKGPSVKRRAREEEERGSAYARGEIIQHEIRQVWVMYKVALPAARGERKPKKNSRFPSLPIFSWTQRPRQLPREAR